jgi:hypothetical protein
VLISNGNGEAVAYALGPLEERGILFVSPGEALYEGMIIGENAKPDDLEVNPMKSKQLTNFRSTGKDDAIRLTPPKIMTLEQAIAYIDDDEMVEVTPKSIRIRKAILDPHERKKASRKKEAASGVAPPALAGAESEPVYGLDGTLLPTDPDGADTEGVAALPDGRFWIAEEYGPSLLLVGADGTVQRRLVPAGMAALHADSTVPTSPALPAIAAARKLNRGFEALALTSDGGALAVMFQSPLAHPDRAAHEGGDVVRLWLLDAASGALIAEHAYPLDPPEAFRRDCAAGPVARSDIKVSEIAFAADGSLLVLERVTRSTRIHRVTLDPATRLPARMADPAQRPTLEQLGQSGAAQAGLPLLAKTLVLSTDDLPEVCVDLEGLLVLDDGKLLLSNDSDYGIEGAETQFWLAEADEG